MTSFSLSTRGPRLALTFFAALGCPHCADAPNLDSKTSKPSNAGRDAGEDSEARYVVASLVTSSDSDSAMYVSFVGSLDGQQVDHRNGREFPGSSDLWVHGGKVYISDYETQVITKFRVEDGELVQEARMGLGAYEVSGFGFWMNTFIDEHKAYIVATPNEAIVWDPTTMEIVETLELPTPEGDDTHLPVAAFGDRATRVRHGLFYQPIYYAGESYFEVLQYTVIHVIDIESDEVVATIEAPCPGLDFATTIDEDLYFSSWAFAPVGAAVLDGPRTCVAKIAADAPYEAEVAFDIAQVTDGLEGGLFRSIGANGALLSVLDPSHAEERGADAITSIAFGANWRFWSYDVDTGDSAPLAGIDWNAGSTYPAGTRAPIILVPSGDYSDTTAYDLSDSDAKVRLKTNGWTLRLFEL